MHHATILTYELSEARLRIAELELERAKMRNDKVVSDNQYECRIRDLQAALAKQEKANADLRHQLTTCREALRSATEQLAAPKLRICVTVE